jgi:hypothetical protein
MWSSTIEYTSPVPLQPHTTAAQHGLHVEQLTNVDVYVLG